MSCPCDEEDNSGDNAQTRTIGDSEFEDPFCLPNSPRVITYEMVKNARKTLEPTIPKSPLEKSRKLSLLSGMNIYLKKEFLQETGSFKGRSARYALQNLPDDDKSSGVVTSSSGNHGLAMAYHGKILAIPITVVVPVTTSIQKIEAIKDEKAAVIIEGMDVQEAKLAAMKLAKEQGLIYINGYDYPDCIAGAGTLGVEILEQLPTANVVVVPVGGAGLIAGIAVAIKTLKPCTKIIGVESENGLSFTHSLKAGKAVMAEATSSLADQIMVPTPGYNAVATAKSLVDRMITVKEQDIAIALLRLIENEKIVVEGSGAIGLGAVLSGQLSDFRGKNVVLLLSGGNIDTIILGRALDRGLAADGRYLKVYVTISDKLDSIAQLCRLIASIGVSITKLEFERTWIMIDVFSMICKAVCETKDYDHALELEKLLKQHYADVRLVHADFPASANVTR